MYIFRCVFRFPSTNIRLEFQSLIEDKLALQKADFSHELDKSLNSGVIKSTEEFGNSTNGRFGSAAHHLLTPLKLNIPDTANTASNSDYTSLMPSPTGTIRYFTGHV